jgi:hypothetical protein
MHSVRYPALLGTLATFWKVLIPLRLVDTTSGYGSLSCALLEQTALMSRSSELIACGGWTAARATQRMGFSVCLSSTGCPWFLKLDQTPQRLRGLVGCNTRGGICELLSAVECCSISLTLVLLSETPLLKGARGSPSIQFLKWYVPSGTPHRCLCPSRIRYARTWKSRFRK